MAAAMYGVPQWQIDAQGGFETVMDPLYCNNCCDEKL